MEAKVILDKRVNENGQVEYLVNRALNRWVNGSKLDANMIIEYENERVRLNDLVRKMEGNQGSLSANPEPFGFDRRVEPERILGAVTKNGVNYVLVKWSCVGVADLMPYDEMKKRYPQLCIEFLEKTMRRNVKKEQTS